MSDNSKNKVTVIPGGPLVLEGEFMIKGIDGNLLSTAEKVYLCRCGKSNNKPFCDGEHKK